MTLYAPPPLPNIFWRSLAITSGLRGVNHKLGVDAYRSISYRKYDVPLRGCEMATLIVHALVDYRTERTGPCTGINSELLILVSKQSRHRVT